MAIEIPQAEAVSRPYFSTRFNPNVYRRCAGLQLLYRHKRMLPGGAYAVWPIDYRELATAQARGPREQISFQGRDTMTSVKSEWAYYHATTVIFADERTENAGEAQVIRLTKRKADEVQKDLATLMGRDLYVQNPSGRGFNSLSRIISAASFGGVDEEVFRSNVQSQNTVKFYGAGDDSLTTAINGTLFGEDACTHALIAPQMKSLLEAAWMVQGGRLQMARNKDLVDLGLKTFRFMDVDFVADQFLSETDALKQSIFGIDINGLECYESATSTSSGEWKDGLMLGYPDALVRVPRWSGQLTAVRRRTMFRITDVASVQFS